MQYTVSITYPTASRTGHMLCGQKLVLFQLHTWCIQCLHRSLSMHHCYQRNTPAHTHLAWMPGCTRCLRNAGTRYLHCTAQLGFVAAVDTV